MLPFAIAGGGAFASTGLSRHAATHLQLIGRFLSVAVEVDKPPTGGAIVRFGDCSSRRAAET
jgi:hypothetical protein